MPQSKRLLEDEPWLKGEFAKPEVGLEFVAAVLLK